MLIWSFAFICCIQHALMIETSSKEVKAQDVFHVENSDSSAKSYFFLVDVVNTAGKIGETVNLFAQVLKDPLDPSSAYVGWEYNPGQIETIWNENDPDSIDDEKFGHMLTDHGNNTFDYNLTIFADATMSGPYKAHFLLNGNVNTQGHVVILDALRCPPTGVVKDEGELITLSCDTYFYGYKSPVLKWFVKDIEIPANVIVVDNRIFSIINTTAAVEQDEVTYSCRLMFEQGEGEQTPPTYQDQCTTFFYVKHAVYNVTIDPNPEDAPGEVLQMSLGEYINCSAGGRPEPGYTWRCDDGQIIPGASLLMTESFVREGGASVMCTCEAENVVDGLPYSAERDVNFVVGSTAESFFVGFTAWKSTTQSYSTGDTIIYEMVPLNEGGHYTPSTGHFECPISGVYFAHITGRVSNTDNLQILIVKNNELCGSINEFYSRLPSNTMSNGCLMECSAGESIHVEAFANDGSVYGDPSVPYSTFSVLLMNQLGGEHLHESFDGSTAWMPEDQTYSVGDVIRFPNVHYNQPGSYEPSVSRYTCRENGIYLVMVTVMKYTTVDLQMGVQHDSNIVMSLSDNESGNEYNQISNSVLLRCVSSQVISVKATGSGEVNGNVDSDFASFTVIMMHQEASEKHVSFVACSVSKSTTQAYISEATITYDVIAVNVGNLFNPDTSQFVCQTEAVYYVTATARKSFTNDLQINIMHETTTLFRLEDLGTANPENTVSNSALIRCGAQEVIQVKAAGSGSIYGSTGGFTTFNVMKIS